MTREEFYAMPKVSTYFPLTFDGLQRWMSFVVECGDCKESVGGDDTRGFIVPLYVSSSYRDLPIIIGYHVTAQALCPHCEKLTTADYVLRSDMTLTGRHPESGSECTWKMRKLTMWERFVRFVCLKTE